MSAHAAWLWLATRENLGAGMLARLLQKFGDAAEVFAAGRAALSAIPGLTRAQCETLCDKDMSGAERILEDCDAQDIAIITLENAAYPALLKQIADPPLVLYLRGRLPDFEVCPGIAVVGTRSASVYGLATARSMARALATAGFTVVTGMAKGVDGEASWGALQAGSKTVAVLGCGADCCYPKSNQALMDEILQSGAVLSEYPPGTPPLPHHFPVRNRIISGLCLGTLIVEAGIRSGALITAHAASDQNRDVFVVPGNLGVPGFEGSNGIIASSEGQLIRSPMDIVLEYQDLLACTPHETRILQAYHGAGKPQPVRRKTPPAPPRTHPPGLTAEENAVADAIREGAQAIDEIVERTGLPAPHVTAALTMLELNGALIRRAGKLSLQSRAEENT